MSTDEIENAIEHAINALGLAKIALTKSALPVFSERDILRKGLADEPRASASEVLARGDALMKAATSAIDDLKARLDSLEGALDTKPATYAISRGRS